MLQAEVPRSVVAGAVECKTKFLVGTWAMSDYDKGDAADFVQIAVLEFNEKGQVRDGSVFWADKAKPTARFDRGQLTVSHNCGVTGEFTVTSLEKPKKTFKYRVNGTMDPKNGILYLKPNGADEQVFYQQWN
jgi:hypothetical protein